jgi:glutamate synthase (NADPH/NADH) large chain
MVTSGCVMARQCHENTCPVGVATQNEDLRDRFPGQPQHVVNYMTFIAQELREIMAELGFETVDDMVGRVDVLRQRDDLTDPKAKKLDLSSILAEPAGDDDRYKTREQTHEVDEQLDWDIIDEAEDAIERGDPISLDMDISNVHRAVGATLSNRISTEHGTDGLPDDTIRVDFEGTAGQSYGAFLQDGVTFELTGTANDYVGKGLSGGRLVVNTPADAPYEPEDNTLIGNVALYGATQGELYVNGPVGDHGCEYMTGGAVAVLGDTGKNFAAGMSGGVAYVLDREGDFEAKVNRGMVSTFDTLDDRDRRMLRRLVENHVAYTGSDRGQYVLDNWEDELENFVKVLPDAYADIIAEDDEADVRTEPPAAATPTAGGSDDAVPGQADD